MRQYFKKYGLLSILISIPVYWAALYYIQVVKSQEREELAIVATLVFFGCVFTGRYLAIVWRSLNKAVPNNFYVFLGVVIGVNVLWLFIHADFQFSRFPAINLFLFWLPYLVLCTSTGLLIKFFRANLSSLQVAEAHAAHSKTELHLLQSQLSPHFLFNTLNNMYGISITKHEKVPALLLKLSELLRYAVYEAGELFVPLKYELAYIRNYIDFEKLRIGDRLVLNTSLQEITGENIKIAPMLLMVFIENAFKHAKNSTDQKIYVDMMLRTTEHSILFSVKNSMQMINAEDTGKKYSGFGLENGKKRLNLLYPGEYDLQLEQQEGFYTVLLQLKIKPYAYLT